MIKMAENLTELDPRGLPSVEQLRTLPPDVLIQLLLDEVEKWRTNYRRILRWTVKSSCMSLAAMGTTQSRKVLLQEIASKMKETNIDEMLQHSSIISGEQVKDAWNNWRNKKISVPTIDQKEKPGYHLYMYQLITFLLDVFQEPTQPLLWKIFRERGILFTGRFFAKFPDLLLAVPREVHPTIGGENILMEFKRSLEEGSSNDQSLRKTAVAEAIDYASYNLMQALNMTPDADVNQEFFTFAIAANVTHINIIKISIQPKLIDENVPPALKLDSFCDSEYQSTGWLRLVPRGDDDDTLTMEVTQGFQALCKFLTADPTALMKLHCETPFIDEITEQVLNLRGAQMRYMGRLGRGGFSDAIYFSNKDNIPAEEEEHVVAKVVRGKDRPERAMLEGEITTLMLLNQSNCIGVPTLIFPLQLPVVDSKFFLTSECGVPLLTFLRDNMPENLIESIQARMETSLEEGEFVLRIGGNTELEQVEGGSSTSAAGPSSDIEDSNTTREAKKQRIVEFSHTPVDSNYTDLIESYMRKVSEIVEDVYAKTKLVHMDIRPANIVVLPNGKVMLIDWGSAVKEQQRVTEFVGVPAFQSDELVYAMEQSFMSIHSTVANSFTSRDIIIRHDFDRDALKFTHSALLHGGNNFVPPWDHCSNGELRAFRTKWYQDHSTILPQCSCLQSLIAPFHVSKLIFVLNSS